MITNLECPYRTDRNGNVVSDVLDKDVVNSMYDIKKMLVQFKNPSSELCNLIDKLEWYFIKSPDPNWIVGNRDEIKCEILFLSDLDIFSDDSIEEKTLKTALSDKLLSLFNKNN